MQAGAMPSIPHGLVRGRTQLRQYSCKDGQGETVAKANRAIIGKSGVVVTVRGNIAASFAVFSKGCFVLKISIFCARRAVSPEVRYTRGSTGCFTRNRGHSAYKAPPLWTTCYGLTAEARAYLTGIDTSAQSENGNSNLRRRWSNRSLRWH